MSVSSKVLCAALLAAIILSAAIWYAVLEAETNDLLTVSFLDVGQGDAIFIEAPSGQQILIDGGPDRSVLRELGRHMPLFDRTIDVVIATHPDADHVSGLIDVLERYRVSHIFESGAIGDAPAAGAFKKAVAFERANRMTAIRGQIIDLGDGARLEILFPDRDMSGVETNTSSIVARLVYGNSSVMLTGDSPESIEEYLVALHGKGLDSDVLKAGHHGSRTSSSLLFVGMVSPKYAVLSRGCDNTYGHPHAEVLETFERLEVLALDTCESGTITFLSDGQRVWRK